MNLRKVMAEQKSLERILGPSRNFNFGVNSIAAQMSLTVFIKKSKGLMNKSPLKEFWDRAGILFLVLTLSLHKRHFQSLQRKVKGS